MKDSIRLKLERLADRRDEVGRMLADPAVLARPDAYRDLSMEFSRLDPVVQAFAAWQELERQREAARAMAADPDREVRELADQEQLAFVIGALQQPQVRVAKLIGQPLLGQEHACRQRDPALAIQRQTAARYDAMHMRMSIQ